MRTRLLGLALGTMIASAGFGASVVGPLHAQSPVTPDVQAAFLAAWVKEPRVDVGVPADGAKVVVVKFSDYECPGCRATHFTYDPFLDDINSKQPGAIKYVIKDFPLNVKCNANWTTSGPQHPATCESAVAARIARDRGKGAEMDAWLWDHQESMPSDVVAALREIAGVNDFDLQYPDKMKEIRKDEIAGGLLQVHGTPSYFVNGIRVRGFIDNSWSDQYMLVPELFEIAVRYELKREP